MAEAGGELVGVAAGAVFRGPRGTAEPVVPGGPVAPGGLGSGGGAGASAGRAGWGLTEAIVEFLEARGGHGAAACRHRPGAAGLRAARVRPRDRLRHAQRPDPGPGVHRGDGAGRRAADLEAVLALDRAATGEDRRRLLAALWPTGGLVAAVDGRVLGYHLASPWRPGGATIAADAGTGLALLDAAGRASGTRSRSRCPPPTPPPSAGSSRLGFQERYRTIRCTAAQGHLGPGGPVRRPQPVLGADPDLSQKSSFTGILLGSADVDHHPGRVAELGDPEAAAVGHASPNETWPSKSPAKRTWRRAG